MRLREAWAGVVHHVEVVERVSAWGLCVHSDAVLVQYRNGQSFFRLPGGGIEHGETAAQALRRELIEEYALDAEVGELCTTFENLYEVDGRTRHEIVLIHAFTCALPDGGIQHRQHRDISLDYRRRDQLSGVMLERRLTVR
jgi:8-oxo-dGTP pyrophosphatase MutT (NUDIX family)